MLPFFSQEAVQVRRFSAFKAKPSGSSRPSQTILTSDSAVLACGRLRNAGTAKGARIGAGTAMAFAGVGQL